MASSTFKKKNQQDEEKSLVCVAAYLDEINLGKEKQKSIASSFQMKREHFGGARGKVA